VIVVGALTLLGLAIRLVLANDAVVGDETSTYWVVSGRSLRGVLSMVHGDQEITPPLYYVAAWLSTQIDHSPQFLRGPSLVAGVASIPVIYLLGLRTVGRPAALVATVLTVFSPFMIFFSTEARSYGLMTCLVMVSTLAMLVAVDDRGRRRWWVVYAVASGAAVYTHYTSVFALGAQFVWLLWAHPEARKPALLANLAALVAFLPWTTGIINDFDSPSADILAELSAGNAHEVGRNLQHWAIGHYSGLVAMDDVPGTPALVLLGVALIVAVAGIAITQARGRGADEPWHLDRRLLLLIAILFAVPVGEVVVSALGTSLLLTRNLAAAWPAFALCFAALLVAAGPRLRYVAAGLAIVAFAIAGTKLLDVQYQRADYQAAATFIDNHASSRDVVINAASFDTAPVTPLEIGLDEPHRVFRAGEESSLSETIASAVAAAGGRPIYLVGTTYFRVSSKTADLLERTGRRLPSAFPAPYRLVQNRAYPGLSGVVVSVYATRPGQGR
jgi:uncharacterized membrane protein